MKTRNAEIEDAAAIAALATQLGYPSTTEQVAPRLAALTSDDRQAIFVAESTHGEVGGWTQVRVVDSVYLDRVAELSGLIVDEQHRGQGVGGALLQAAEGWAGARGCSLLRVRSNVIRTRAHHFYTERGYKSVKAQKVFEKPLKPTRK